MSFLTRVFRPCVAGLLGVFAVFLATNPRLRAEDSGARVKAEHEIETTSAWESFEKKDYKAAIAHAEKVIDKYAPVAARMQNQLTVSKESPPLGRVSEVDAKLVHNHGPLNDVAACWFIRGRAEHKLGLKDNAKTSFQEASKLVSLARHPSASRRPSSR